MSVADYMPQDEPYVDFPPERNFSWEEFKSFVSTELLSDNTERQAGGRDARALPIPRYLYRGQADQRWNLVSSFDRTFKSLPDDDRDSMHHRLIDCFREECVHYPEYAKDIESNESRLALAQHYGLPTRLLDWTDSPYVAAFYAFSAHLRIDRGEGVTGKGCRVAVWILDRNARSYWNGDRGVAVIRPEPLHNERQKRQSGWFTYATMTHRTLEEYVLALGNQPQALRKVTLPAADAERVMKDLNLMRINARELNADLGGAAINALVRAVI